MVHTTPLFLEIPTLLKMFPGVSGTCSTTTCRVPYLPWYLGVRSCNTCKFGLLLFYRNWHYFGFLDISTVENKYEINQSIFKELSWGPHSLMAACLQNAEIEWAHRGAVWWYVQINTAWLLVSNPFELVCEAWKSVTDMLALQILLKHHTLYWQCTGSE